jgi:hypothetical protein
VSEENIYNPLAKKNLGESVEKALLESQVHSLLVKKSFEGAGIYAIYYSGSFSAYKAIAERNKSKKLNQPIYVGKAIPSGGRKGGVDLSGKAGQVLFNRLSEHAESIQLTKNLNIKDFSCRFLVVDDIWIPLGESLLITKFMPLWNVVVDGFGNHDPGSGRYSGMRPSWDTLHPGRKWAEKCKPSKKTEKEILADIEEFFKKGKMSKDFSF